MKKSLTFLLIIYLVSNFFIFEVRQLDVIKYKSDYISIYIVSKGALLVFCGLVSLLILINKHGFEKYTFNNAIKYILLFNIWAFFSIIWSLNRNLTLYRSIEFFVGIILFYLIIIEINDIKNLYKSLKIILIIIILITFSNVINFAINSGASINSQYFRDIILRSNSGSMVGGILAIVGLSEMIEHKKGFAIFILGFFTLIIFKSSSSLIFFLYSTVFIFTKNIKKALLIIGLFLLFNYLFIDKLIELILRFDPTKSYEHITTLTGRTMLWEGALSIIFSKLLFGYGFGSSREIFLNVTSWSAGNAHNGYLASLIELGIGGLVLTIMIIIKTLSNLQWMLKFYPYAGRMLFAILFLILSNNLTVVGIGAQANVSWFVLFFILFSIVTIKSKSETF